MQSIILLTEMRLQCMKAIKESAHVIGALAAVTKHMPLIDELGTQIQNEINILHAQYASVGMDFEDFYDDMIEMLERCGFSVYDDYIKDFLEEDGIVVFELLCGLDKATPYDLIGLTFQIMESIE